MRFERRFMVRAPDPDDNPSHQGSKITAKQLQEKLIQAYKRADPIINEGKRYYYSSLQGDIANITIKDGNIQIDPSFTIGNSSLFTKKIATEYMGLEEGEEFKMSNHLLRTDKLIISPDQFEQCFQKVNEFVAYWHNIDAAKASTRKEPAIEQQSTVEHAKKEVQSAKEPAASPPSVSNNSLPAVSQEASQLSSKTTNAVQNLSTHYYFEKDNKTLSNVEPAEVSGSIRIDIQDKSVKATVTKWPDAEANDSLEIKAAFAQSMVTQFLATRRGDKNRPVDISINPKAPEEAAFLKAALEKSGITSTFKNINDIPSESVNALMNASKVITARSLFTSNAAQASTPATGLSSQDAALPAVEEENERNLAAPK